MTRNILPDEKLETPISITKKPKRKNFEKNKAKPEKNLSTTGQVSDLVNVRSSNRKRKPSERLEKFQATALAKLGIDRDRLNQAAPISEILENAEGGIPSVIAAMRFSDDPSVQEFLKVYDESTESDRRLIPLEAFCLLADVDSSQLLGAAIVALMQQNANIVKIIAVTSHPATMRARVRNALKPGGYKDRNAIDTALRFLPQPKGSTTLIQVPGGAIVQESMNPDDVDTDDLFPNLSETQKLLTD